MPKPRRDVICPIDPIGLKREEAAAFVRFSEVVFDRLVKEGLMPQPHEYGKLLVWDAEEVAAAFRKLPRRNLQDKGVSAQDEGEEIDFRA
jgi:predicted DNA-binding transcriptional regulator AlpA